MVQASCHTSKELAVAARPVACIGMGKFLPKLRVNHESFCLKFFKNQELKMPLRCVVTSKIWPRHLLFKLELVKMSIKCMGLLGTLEINYLWLFLVFEVYKIIKIDIYTLNSKSKPFSHKILPNLPLKKKRNWRQL